MAAAVQPSTFHNQPQEIALTKPPVCVANTARSTSSRISTYAVVEALLKTGYFNPISFLCLQRSASQRLYIPHLQKKRGERGRLPVTASQKDWNLLGTPFSRTAPGQLRVAAPKRLELLSSQMAMLSRERRRAWDAPDDANKRTI
jgi:hypothetical protein